MNNLYRELAPISEEAWSEIEEEATRTLKRHLAGRRVVDLRGPYGFTFSAVGPGSHGVAQVVPAGRVQTQPELPTAYSFVTQSGHNLLGVVFGNHAAASLTPTAVSDDGQPGYSETGTWSTVVGGFNGTNRVTRTVHSGSPSATASWDFIGLPAGTYDVYVTFSGHAVYSTAAPFAVFDGPASLGVQSIDQAILVTQPQGSRAQGSYGGVGWVQLGSFTINTGEILVKLNNVASNNFVAADGVLIVAH